MRILFGVAGEGTGHAVRAEVVANYLQSSGHQVKIITYHQGLKYLSSKFDTEEIFGLRFFHKEGKVDYPTTILKNIKKTPEATKSFSKVKNIIKKFQPTIVITDFEPLSSLCAHIYHLPLISIDNQHIITHTKIEYDKKWLANYLLYRATASTMAFQADAYILTSFFQLHINHKNIHPVPPILRKEVLTHKISTQEHILVYTTTPDTNKIINLLENSPQQFIIYGLNKNTKKQNCTFKKFSKVGFLDDLASSKAVIGTAGLSLITEAIYLHKPYLALPVKKRFEQLLNSYYLKKMGYGNYSENLTQEELLNFLENIPRYKEKLSRHKKTNNQKLYNLLDNLLKKFSKKQS